MLHMKDFHAAQGCIQRLDDIVEAMVALILVRIIEKVRKRTSNKELIPSKEKDADQNRIDLNFDEIHEEVKAPNENTMEIFVPYGSGNDCARAWGLHRLSWQQALAHALHARSSSIDVGRIELEKKAIHYFHSSLAVGFDASVGNRALAGPQFLRGLPRYLLATLRELAHLKNWYLKVEVDGLLIHEGATLLASALNTPTYGGGMPAVPHALINDGQLNLLVGGRFNRLQTLWMLPLLLIGKHLGHPRIQCHACSNATISNASLVPVAADGETLGFAAHIQVTCLPNALQVVKF